MVICLERGADLHTAQLMPLPLTVSCFSQIQIGLTFLVLAHLGSPGKGPLNGCVCVCVPLLSTFSFHSFSLLIRSSSVSAITAKSSAYSSSHGRATLRNNEIKNKRKYNHRQLCTANKNLHKRGNSVSLKTNNSRH